MNKKNTWIGYIDDAMADDIKVVWGSPDYSHPDFRCTDFKKTSTNGIYLYFETKLDEQQHHENI